MEALGVLMLVQLVGLIFAFATGLVSNVTRSVVVRRIGIVLIILTLGATFAAGGAFYMLVEATFGAFVVPAAIVGVLSAVVRKL